MLKGDPPIQSSLIVASHERSDSRADEDHRCLRADAVDPVDQQEIASDVALTVIRPLASQLVIQPLLGLLPTQSAAQLGGGPNIDTGGEFAASRS